MLRPSGDGNTIANEKKLKFRDVSEIIEEIEVV